MQSCYQPKTVAATHSSRHQLIVLPRAMETHMLMRVVPTSTPESLVGGFVETISGRLNFTFCKFRANPTQGIVQGLSVRFTRKPVMKTCKTKAEAGLWSCKIRARFVQGPFFWHIDYINNLEQLPHGFSWFLLGLS